MFEQFKKFLIEKERLPEHNVPYYVKRVSDCHRYFDLPETTTLTKEQSSQFLKHLATNHQDWQVEQADRLSGSTPIFLHDRMKVAALLPSCLPTGRSSKLDMAAAFQEQLQQPSLGDLNFEDRFAMIVDREWSSREDRKLTKRLRSARLRTNATIEEIDYRHPRGLDKSVIRTLASCQWISAHQNVIVTGTTGIGKTYLAEAFVNKACREGFNAVRYRSTLLFEEMKLARADGSYFKLLGRLGKMELIAIDDWSVEPLTEEERRDCLELMEDRHGLKSTFITSQYPVSK